MKPCSIAKSVHSHTTATSATAAAAVENGASDQINHHSTIFSHTNQNHATEGSSDVADISSPHFSSPLTHSGVSGNFPSGSTRHSFSSRSNSTDLNSFDCVATTTGQNGGISESCSVISQIYDTTSNNLVPITVSSAAVTSSTNSKMNVNKLEGTISDVLTLATSSDPYEDIFCLPNKNVQLEGHLKKKEIIPLPKVVKNITDTAIDTASEMLQETPLNKPVQTETTFVPGFVQNGVSNVRDPLLSNSVQAVRGSQAHYLPQSDVISTNLAPQHSQLMELMRNNSTISPNFRHYQAPISTTSSMFPVGAAPSHISNEIRCYYYPVSCHHNPSMFPLRMPRLGVNGTTHEVSLPGGNNVNININVNGNSTVDNIPNGSGTLHNTGRPVLPVNMYCRPPTGFIYGQRLSAFNGRMYGPHPCAQQHPGPPGAYFTSNGFDSSKPISGYGFSPGQCEFSNNNAGLTGGTPLTCNINKYINANNANNNGSNGGSYRGIDLTESTMATACSPSVLYTSTTPVGKKRYLPPPSSPMEINASTTPISLPRSSFLSSNSSTSSSTPNKKRRTCGVSMDGNNFLMTAQQQAPAIDSGYSMVNQENVVRHSRSQFADVMNHWRQLYLSLSQDASSVARTTPFIKPQQPSVGRHLDYRLGNGLSNMHSRTCRRNMCSVLEGDFSAPLKYLSEAFLEPSISSKSSEEFDDVAVLRALHINGSDVFSDLPAFSKELRSSESLPYVPSTSKALDLLPNDEAIDFAGPGGSNLQQKPIGKVLQIFPLATAQETAEYSNLEIPTRTPFLSPESYQALFSHQFHQQQAQQRQCNYRSAAPVGLHHMASHTAQIESDRACPSPRLHLYHIPNLSLVQLRPSCRRQSEGHPINNDSNNQRHRNHHQQQHQPSVYHAVKIVPRDGDSTAGGSVLDQTSHSGSRYQGLPATDESSLDLSPISRFSENILLNIKNLMDYGWDLVREQLDCLRCGDKVFKALSSSFRTNTEAVSVSLSGLVDNNKSSYILPNFLVSDSISGQFHFCSQNCYTSFRTALLKYSASKQQQQQNSQTALMTVTKFVTPASDYQDTDPTLSSISEEIVAQLSGCSQTDCTQQALTGNKTKPPGTGTTTSGGNVACLPVKPVLYGSKFVDVTFPVVIQANITAKYCNVSKMPQPKKRIVFEQLPFLLSETKKTVSTTLYEKESFGKELSRSPHTHGIGCVYDTNNGLRMLDDGGHASFISRKRKWCGPQKLKVIELKRLRQDPAVAGDVSSYSSRTMPIDSIPLRSDSNALLDNEHVDKRTCLICRKHGDASEHGPGRLLQYRVNEDVAAQIVGYDCSSSHRSAHLQILWLHLNCALWCFENVELANGCIIDTKNSIRRALATTCTWCHELGAGIGCYYAKCEEIFHILCAVKSGCTFFTDRGIYCYRHTEQFEQVNSSLILSDIGAPRRIYMNRDEDHEVANLIRLGMVHHDNNNNDTDKCTLCFRIGSLQVLDLGNLTPAQAGSGRFHDVEHIYPVGYRAVRYFWSTRKPFARCRYLCEILERPDGSIEKDMSIDDDSECNFRPLFKVTQLDTMECHTGDDCLQAWDAILRTVRALRRKNRLIRLHTHLIQGQQLFGLQEPLLRKMLESLPHVLKLNTHKFAHPFYQLHHDFPNTSSKSGCLRCDPMLPRFSKLRNSGCTYPLDWQLKMGQRPIRERVMPLYVQPTSSMFGNNPYMLSGAVVPHAMTVRLITPAESALRQRMLELSESIKRLSEDEWNHNVYLSPSRYHGFGVYAAKDFDTGTFIVRLVGELVRPSVAERRLRNYKIRNLSVYMLRLNENSFLDATRHGGLARYVHHSLQPNCFVECYYIHNAATAHLVLSASRRIARAEELTFDYSKLQLFSNR